MIEYFSMPTFEEEHYCDNPASFPINKFHQTGSGKGKFVLIVGESPAANGWRKSGKAFYNPEMKILPTGKRLNLLLSDVDLSVEKCGFTEIVKCYLGKNRKDLSKCGRNCWPIFVNQIKSVNYKLIITLGVKTMEIIKEMSKEKIEMGKLSTININKNNYLILPIYHPSPINPHNMKRNQTIFAESKDFLLRVLKQT